MQNSYPSLAESALYLAWEYPHLDLSVINPEWLRYETYRKQLRDIVKWHKDGKPQDVVAFSHSCGNRFAELWEMCRAYKIKPESIADLAKKLEWEYTAEQVYGLQQDMADLDPIESIRKVREFARKMDEIEAPQADYHTANVYAGAFMEILEKRRQEREPELKTGFPKLDAQLWGLHRGEVITIGARTGRGKSVFLLNVATNVLLSGKRVLYFSTEMSTADKYGRILALLTGLPASKFRHADLTSSEWAQVTEKVEWLGERNCFDVCDIVSPNLGQIESLIRKSRPDVVMLDYLGLFSMPKEDRKDLQIGEFMKHVKSMARSLNVVMLVASQLNRQVDQRDKMIPTLADLKESGSIEQESDIVILIYDDPERVSIADGQHRYLKADIAKNRHGQPGIVDLLFRTKNLKLEEIAN